MDLFLRAGQGSAGAGLGLQPGGLGAPDNPSLGLYCCSFRAETVANPGIGSPANMFQAGKTWTPAGELLRRLR